MSNKFEELGLDSIITSQLDYNLPTDIQRKFIPEALNGRDVLASSPTGTGKTLAFILPVLQNLIDFPRKRKEAPKVLILCPTRELANQVHGILNIFLASITSYTLFIIVAESIEIFFPIFQFGWLTAFFTSIFLKSFNGKL